MVKYRGTLGPLTGVGSELRPCLLWQCCRGAADGSLGCRRPGSVYGSYEDNFHLMWRHPSRPDLNLLVRFGVNPNWQPIGFGNFKDMIQRFNALAFSFSVLPLEFGITEGSYRQHQMSSYSIIIE